MVKDISIKEEKESFCKVQHSKTLKRLSLQQIQNPTKFYYKRKEIYCRNNCYFDFFDPIVLMCSSHVTDKISIRSFMYMMGKNKCFGNSSSQKIREHLEYSI
ncbi:unnamed protein product [Paramecium octaurelia]|uniref:Uncharacterized protein n=1 Tax=Paramecium octaurelia TaxID=43137 RepID=A0A8S1W732_PAROT|nr:unnamed protein product [Paramecium octaurelia]